MRKITAFIMAVMMLAALCACAAEDGQTPGEAVDTEKADLAEILASQVKYDYEGAEDKALDCSLEWLCYGAFSSADADEILACFNAAPECHPDGLDKTVIALFDGETHEIIAQRTVHQDAVQVTTYTDSCGRSYVLYYSVQAGSGYVLTDMELLTVENGEFTEKNLCDMELREWYHYALTAEKSILVIDCGEATSTPHPDIASAEFNIIAELVWDEENAAFVQKDAEMFCYLSI